ncbi:BREX system P-loop protein BrxC [Robertkochia sediminum]|uniref:BREX system P-loop protein BrxC n=1 Tax=Robertkochia sediminum TaxID=2785326 RepID=UPI0019316FED|nr:BREX system P-loop protein BrxC [Robertkochia sediminum]MBL7471375.1 BREX system P-loop protein BrxC [Robertkochia sediminum]
MQIKDFFEKDINRNIETVIKADDRDHVATEVAEYVITDEIAKKTRNFFQAYNDYSGANGVWISGFFGSGKSHLLKILSYVLENKAFDGQHSGEVFAGKIENDALLRGDVQNAVRIPSESILFNIDQQSQIKSKTDENAILAVFYKVFYDHLGYYGFQPHVAEFEMWLDKQEKFQPFKEKFAAIHGKSWEEARRDYFDPLVTDDLAEALAEINNTQAEKYEDILDELEDKQKQSIEDFSLKVKEYIDTKPKGCRLNFFVDEVGQYISDNTKLMLNLQTIAESLATKTQGGSWILVTSQEDMETIVGDMNKQQQNDFSRIQARFKIKVPLTSANVDEVIEKRLLKKTSEVQGNLTDLYKKEKSHLETLISFSDIGVQFKGFKSDQDFGNKYPFLPYQFDLFQQCRKALSTHNAFQGKQMSTGERSMLGVFQQVIQHIEEQGVKTLVSFDQMFEGIRNELKSEIQSAIILAERNLDDAMAIRVLKTLFMVKYYSNFKPTKRNIATLLLDHMDADLKQHGDRIEKALEILERQSYIQRNGEVFEFLTDDEKDVEEEIKGVDIDDQATNQLLRQLFFDEIIRDNKIRFQENKQDYDFTNKIDGVVMGREKELEIEIVTGNAADHGNPTVLASHTMGTSGMKMVLPSDFAFSKDLKLYLQTEKYLKQSSTASNTPERKRILGEKGQLNATRKRNLLNDASRLLKEATVYMNGGKQEVSKSSDAKTYVINAFQQLVKMVYTNLRMLGTEKYSEDTIKQTLRSRQDDLFGADDQTMTEAENEVLNQIKRRKMQSDRTTLSDLKDYFSKKPYGWYPNAIWTVAAKLYKRGKIEVKKDGNLLEDEEVLNAIINSAHHNNTLLEPQVDIDPRLVKSLRDIYAEAFDESCPVNEAKEVALAFREKLKDMGKEVDKLLYRKSEYPFLKELQPFSEQLGRWSGKEYTWFLQNQSEFEDALLDAKEDVLGPVMRFMNGSQLRIYDEVKKVLRADTSNFDYVEGEELKSLKDLLDDPKPYVDNKLREAKEAQEALSKKVLEKIEEAKENANQAIDQAIEAIRQMEEFDKLDDEYQEKVLKPFEQERQKVAAQRYIANLRTLASDVSGKMLTSQRNALMVFARPKPEPVPVSGGESPQKETAKVAEPEVHYIDKKNIPVKFTKTELRTEEDVDAYVEALRATLKKHIQDKRRISL